MIIAALEIENYKQYAGVQRIEFPEQGIVAVTGPNGAGKTTLFEAIEWCLYCPRAIPQASVPPRDGVGNTVVRVTLEDPVEGKRYCVQRELRASGTQAEIYLEDDPGSPLVQGTREVTRHVARHLIGLAHPAFVSTFFTKQKELQFFADRSPTERRTEVGRLLGLEAVREAQRELGEGRTAARTHADSLRREHERRLDDRDLAAEKVCAADALAEAERREAAAEDGSTKASADAERARAELERIRDLQAQDAAMGQVLADLAGQARAAAARRDAAVAELSRLELRAAERMQLAAAAATLASLAAAVEGQEQEREKARRLRSLEDSHRTALEITTRIQNRIEALVEEHLEAASGLPGWTWSVADAQDAAKGAKRLFALATSLNAVESRKRVEALQEALHQATSLSEVEKNLASYYRLRDQLAAQRAALLDAGIPGEALERAQASVREAREEEHVARLALAAARVEREENEKLADGLRQHLEDPSCPTCTRPLGRNEAERLIALLESKIEQLGADEDTWSARAQEAAVRLKEGENAEAEARARQDALRSLDDRLAEGQRVIEEAEARRDDAAKTLHEALVAINLKSAPTSDDIDLARRDAARIERVTGLAGLLRQLGDEAEAQESAREDAERGISELGPICYDAAEHQALTTSLEHARRAAAQVESIDVELAERGGYERRRTKEDRELANLDQQQRALAVKRAQLAFDALALRQAQGVEAAARVAAQDAREAHAAARQAVRDARTTCDRVEADHGSLQQLIEEADRLAREADELTRMYDEFGEFDRFVARHVGPLLAETTERMLSQVTNGKYDHVQFDENYGIEVFDGDEAFPLAGFSGGERDVVALCARLALSEVVGSAATRPPRFLVLDEVFGSLDSERRGQLLEALGMLSASGHFRQMFIISHVDDVQQSPVMNEAWTIEERDGVSRVVRPELVVAFPA